MSEIREIKVESPYGSEDAVLELKIDTIDDGYILENVAKLVGDYNFSIWIKSVNKNCNVTFNILGLPVTETITTEWKKLSKVVTMNNINLNDIIIAPELNSTVYLYEGFLSEGNLDNSWIPAPEDTDTQMTSIRSELTQTAEDITLMVKHTNGDVSSLRTDLNGITGRVTSAEGRLGTLELSEKTFKTFIKDANDNFSSITQAATQLESRVQTTEGNISSIRQAAGELESRVSTAEGEISTIKQEAGKVQITVGTSIQETTEEFYQSDSATALVGGKWETTQPPWTQGKYIWRRTKIKNGNKDVFYTPNEYGVCITGNTGATGATGTNGVGIKTIENFYLAHTSQTGVTHDTPNWSKTPQNMDSTNRYLWNYELITYDNGSTSKSKPCVIGMYGSTGKDGRGIESIEEFYQKSSSNTTAPVTWSKTVPTLTPTEKYLWNYEKTTYTDKSTNETKKRVIGVYGDKGADGANGANGVGIESVVNYYLAINQNTGVTNKTSGWTTTVQTVSSDKKYLWNYEKITYTNKQIKETDPCIIGMFSKDGVNGQNGTNGTNGKDGVGIKTIEEFYKASSSNKTPPTTWDKTVPTLTPTDRYLWNYEKITYTNNQTKETEKRVIGVYGDKGQTGANGKDGKGILSTKIEYQAGTSGTTAPNGNWGTTIPSVAQGQYLWSKTTITYTDKSTSTSYSVAYIPKNGQNGANGQNGLDGKPGATGTGVGSIVQEYYMSTSKTTQVGSNWQTSMPTWSAGKYLWTRYKITYTNPTSTSWTEPVCDSSWEAVNEVQVGGRNLALNSNSLIQTKEHLMSTYGISPSEGKKLDTPKAESAPVIYGHLVDGETYTISICLKPSPQMTSVEARVSGGKSVLCKLETKGTEKQTLSKTVTCKYAVGATPSDNQVNAFVDFYRMPNSSGTAYGEATIYWVKIERGNKPTDWSPAPEDTQGELDGLNEQVNTNTKHLATLEVNKQEILMNVQRIEKDTSDAINGINEDLSSLHKEVGLAITEDELKIHVSQEINKGVSSVTTNTGFSFNDEGLTVSKSNSEISTKITENGMKVLQNDAVVLEANNVGVNAKNLHATTYLIVGKNSRFEDYGNNRTGCFWIGGA